jgi:kinesin family protein C1
LFTGGQRHFFSFDKVFGPEVKQEQVFVEISQLVQSALDGYKVLLFSLFSFVPRKLYTQHIMTRGIGTVGLSFLAADEWAYPFLLQVCMFAYGQTGSGKTHTMLGNPDVPGEGGVIPRSLEQVFQSSQALSAQGWSFRMQVCAY